MTLDSSSQFTWWVPEDGFRWIQAGNPASWFLGGASPLIGSKARRYWPASGLFLTFVQVKPEKKSIEHFAEQFGFLTMGTALPLEGEHPKDYFAGSPVEPLAWWEQALYEMSFAIDLWTALKSSNRKKLAQWIQWRDDGVVFRTKRQSFDIANLHDTERLSEIQPGDLIKPGWWCLQRLVNEHIAPPKPSQVLLLDPLGRFAGSGAGVTVRLLWDSGHSVLRLRQMPRDLLTAMWLQLARAVEGDRQFNQCEECKNHFEVSSADGARKDKRFCSTACRARAWRKANEK